MTAIHCEHQKNWHFPDRGLGARTIAQTLSPNLMVFKNGKIIDIDLPEEMRFAGDGVDPSKPGEAKVL